MFCDYKEQKIKVIKNFFKIFFTQNSRKTHKKITKVFKLLFQKISYNNLVPKFH